MVLCRLIPALWKTSAKALDGYFSEEQIKQYNENGYNVYFWPNSPTEYKGGTVSGKDIDCWNFVFIDYDHDKMKTYESKEAFVEVLHSLDLAPTLIVDSGGGIHAYWEITDLDAMSFLRLGRRLCRLLKTDDAVQKIAQLMRLPDTLNVKIEGNFRKCQVLVAAERAYTCEQLDKWLPPIVEKDEAYCQTHYNNTYQLNQNTQVNDKLPSKFGKLLKENKEAKAIWSGNSSDRSKDDYRLGHLMFAADFTKEEAMSVLVNTAKAITRAPSHRVNYAQNIVDKIWTFETAGTASDLSESIESLLRRPEQVKQGIRFRCHPCIDNTHRGFRLGDVMGLIGGSGIGKTSIALNIFKWASEFNPDFHHFFVSLEQPKNEIALRWETITQGSPTLNGKVHVISNYDNDGNFRHLSLSEIQEYISTWQKTTGNKVGCVVIDHIGALKKKGANNENQDLMDICHSMKAFAVQTNTFLIMQSQAPREKAGIGDLELNKDAAYGTVYFESYCDFLVTLWQPLKRCHMEQACPTVTAYKFCKIRHKKAKKDVILEDVPYYLYFDSDNEQLREMTQDEETAFKFFLPKATNKRKADRRVEILEYKSVPVSGVKV